MHRAWLHKKMTGVKIDKGSIEGKEKEHGDSAVHNCYISYSYVLLAPAMSVPTFSPM